ncbi:MAG TPA: RbtT/DalT/CsbX family MFS transporter, partial [Terracidiphilus sp.]
MKPLSLEDPAVKTVRHDRFILGMPLALLGGFIAIVFCMTGDGIEQAFLSKYLVNLGFSAADAALVFTVYGATAALSSWLSGVLAEVFTPRRIMLIGVVWWLVFHVLFLWLGLTHPNLPLTLLFYGIRGFAYPMFFYGFFVWVVQKSRPHELASAIGWTWSMFTIGYGIVGSYLPSFTIPWIGYMGTLWMSMAWVLAGGLLILFFTGGVPTAPRIDLQRGETSKFEEISKCVTLIFHNRNIALALITRVICNLSLFGFPVIMPLFYTSAQIGFSVPEWARIWGTFFLVQPVTNVVWGLIGDRIGWMRQMRWFGFVGCGTASLLFYWLPLHFPHNTL